MIELLPLNERPRERLMNLGSEALSVSELIAIILGSGIKGRSVLRVAEELITTFGGIRPMMEASYQELMSVAGIGEVKALQLKASFALALRTLSEAEKPKVAICSPEEAYAQFRPFFWDKSCESVYLMMRDTKGRVIGIEQVAEGSLSNVLIHPRELFLKAIKRSSFSVIIAHNHPSGDPTPSAQDLDLTLRLTSVARILGIPLDDHIILGGFHYSSFYSLGHIPQRDQY